MDENGKEVQIAARFRKYDRPTSKKLSGAAKKRAWLSRERVHDEKGVWRLPANETRYKGLRGKGRTNA